MNRASLLIGAAALLLAAAGCEPERKFSTTEGSVTVQCDESVLPVLRLAAEDFERSYEKARVRLQAAPARSAIAAFAADSVRRIVTARPLNAEERRALSGGAIELQEYELALDGIAVIVHRNNTLRQLRMGMLDSIFSGTVTHWPGRRGGVIDLAVGDVNSSTNEVFRTLALKGRPITPSATPFEASDGLIDYVRDRPDALGIVGLAWLHGREADVAVVALGTPGFRPDTTEPPGRFYLPLQAHLHRRYYPLTRTLTCYNREVLRDVGYGFISYLTSATGQKLFLNNGLVPKTMPVRLIETTSKEVNS